jgi:hypothetical protein
VGRPWPSGFKPLAPHRCGFRIPTGTMDSFMWGSYPASVRNVVASTQVPVPAWNNARKGTWGLPPPVKLECRRMCRCDVKPKQTNKGLCHNVEGGWELLYFTPLGHQEMVLQVRTITVFVNNILKIAFIPWCFKYLDERLCFVITHYLLSPIVNKSLTCLCFSSFWCNWIN